MVNKNAIIHLAKVEAKFFQKDGKTRRFEISFKTWLGDGKMSSASIFLENKYHRRKIEDIDKIIATTLFLFITEITDIYSRNRLLEVFFQLIHSDFS